jgi:ribosome-binding protein aMBF1 (putative translation factor)
MKGRGGRGTTLKKYLAGEMKDPEFRRLYEDAGIELKVALEIAKAREAANLTQGELARRIKTKQQTISRIEQGSQNLTLVTLDRIARALKGNLQVRIIGP